MRLLTRLLEPKATAYAHCDLPCGIYDPAQARIEAESVKAIEEKYQQNTDPEFRARCLIIKEQRSELVKHHLWVLWTDYFKPPHFEKYPQLHTLFNEATKLAGAAGTKGSSNLDRRTSCWARSRRSARSSGRPSRPDGACAVPRHETRGSSPGFQYVRGRCFAELRSRRVIHGTARRFSRYGQGGRLQLRWVAHR